MPLNNGILLAVVEWLRVLRDLQGGGSPCVLVTVAETRGSVPREAGTKMVVTRDATFGTIGGGQLEHEALRVAREMLASGASTPQLCRFGLGPSLGQCCGGSARILLEPISERQEPWQAALRDLVERREPAVLATGIGDWGAGKIVVSAEGVIGALSDPRRHAEAVAAAQALLSASDAGTGFAQGAYGAALFERVRPDGFDLVLFGAGHVGKALVRLLGELPCRVAWIDSRGEQFPHEVPPNVTVECTEMPQYAVDRAPSGAAFLVMTHSHALDLTLCERILRRNDFWYFGLIGSATKRAKFVRRLRSRGFSDHVLDRMVCPIGISGLSGKHPGEIAVAVAAQLLMMRAHQAAEPDQALGQARAEVAS